MKRVGNKSGQLVRSASRRKKTASRFQFDITVNTVSGLKAGGKYFVKWSRGVKVASTKPFVSEKEAATKAGQPINQKLSLLVTLYREDNKKFDAKEAKLSLIAVSAKGQERTIAKTRFDLSGFAGVPSATHNKALPLSDKVFIQATIESRFLKAGAGGPGSAGGSSALSGLSGVSGRSSEEDDDFDDLVIDDVPEPPPPMQTRSKPPSSTASSSSTSHQPPRPPTSVNKATTPSKQSSSTRTSTDSMSSAPSSSAAAMPRIPTSANTQERRAAASPSARKPESPSGRNRRERASSSLTDEIASRASRGEDEQKLARLSRENLRLSAEVEDLRKQQQQQQEKQTANANASDELARLNEVLEQRTREKDDASSALKSTNQSVEKLRERVTELEGQARENERGVAALRSERDDLQARARRLETSERKCAELSREIDRLTVAAAASQSQSTEEGERFAVVEARIATLQAEKQQLERKVKSHQDHSAQVKTTYDKLSDMYSTLREEHTTLQREAEIAKRTAKQQQEQLATSSTSQEGADSAKIARLTAELEQARDEVRALESGRAGSERECERLTSELQSLREQLESANEATDDARREADELAAEAEELKGQRDLAMQRALSKGKSSSSNDSSKGRLSGKAEDELRAAKDEYTRELDKLNRKVGDLETQNTELREDLEYEKSEKTKARDERDKMRETTRALERRTSQAAKAADAMNSMRRELSTHQMRAQDHESIIQHMKSEVERLQAALDEAELKLREHDSGGGEDEMGEVLNALVVTKLALAESQSEKQQLEFAMKKLKKHEKGIQQRLAQHASRLEVKLGQATEELERVKKQRRSENRNEFNELGSDVDY